MNRSTRFTALALTAGLLAAAAPSHAFRMIQNTGVGRFSAGAAVACNAAGGFTHWAANNKNIAWWHNTANQGSGKGTALANSLASWTAVASADHNLSLAGTTTAGFVTDNRNTFLWASGNGCTGSCLAITALVLTAGQVIVETDVSFNNNVTWTTNGANYDTESVAAHEVGHALGIHHTNLVGGTTPTMNASYFGSGGRSLATDDIQALQCAESRY
jgi:hypothetical protein